MTLQVFNSHNPRHLQDDAAAADLSQELLKIVGDKENRVVAWAINPLLRHRSLDLAALNVNNTL